METFDSMIERIASITFFRAATFWVAVILSPAHAEEIPIHSAGFWAPVLIQHQDFGSEKDGYPVEFGDDGNGEMSLYQWSEASEETSSQYHGYFWQYPTGNALGIAFEVVGTETLSRALLMGPQGCQLIDGGEFTLALDPEGRHPIVGVQSLALSTGFGVIDAVMPAEDGVVDWQSLPQDGRRFFRTWNNPPHLKSQPPDIDGVVLRYEPQGGFALSGKSGRGNTPHHWNLLAYQLKPLDTQASGFTTHDATPLDWPCASAFGSLSDTFAELGED